MTPRTITVGSETVQVRTISWPEFWKIRPDLRPANDNDEGYNSPNSSSFVAVGRRS